MSEQIKKSPGQPTSYRPEYCEAVIALGREGKSKAQMAAHFDVARQTIDNWAAANPEFLEALDRAMTHCQAWWENTGQSGMFLQHFNAPVWKKSVEARFRNDYTERQEIGGIDGGPVKLDVTLSADEAYKRLVDG